MIVDLEHHIYTEEELRRRGGKPDRTERTWDSEGRLKIHPSLQLSKVEKHLRFMDEAGIDVSVLTVHVQRDLEELSDLLIPCGCDNGRGQGQDVCIN